MSLTPALPFGMRPCVDCGRPTGNWCDGCEHLGVAGYPPFPNRPYCTVCEDARRACHFCRAGTNESDEHDIAEAIMREVAAAVTQMQPLIGREFTRKEYTLGLLAFISWYTKAERLRATDPLGHLQYIEAPNVSARSAAILFMTKGLAAPGVFEAIRVHFPQFDPSVEAHMAATPTRVWDPAYPSWQPCLTRIIILTTRALAYAFVGGSLKTTSLAIANGLEPTLDITTELIAEWLTESPARLLRSQTIDDAFAAFQAIRREDSRRKRKSKQGKKKDRKAARLARRERRRRIQTGADPFV